MPTMQIDANGDGIYDTFASSTNLLRLNHGSGINSQVDYRQEPAVVRLLLLAEALGFAACVSIKGQP